ncbi:MAG: UDP-N-acetylglucosamine pyrophosphorylase [Ruminococcaceae bacterium]|nr:UDP-N-acetylglucosamine pyrophosphorylase [Oscillospiraceae bacterium]
MIQVKIKDLYNLENTLAKELFADREYPWEILGKIKAFIINSGKDLGNSYEQKGENIWIEKSASVSPTACLNGPLIIDKGAEIRHCAYIRGSVIVGKGAVVGNSCELKNCILFDKVQVPHYNYIGDSVIGYMSHFGAGALTSNVKSDKSLVTVKGKGINIPTGLKKLGAMVGDNVEIGCHAVLCPGTVIGKNTNIYPLSMVRGVIEKNSIYKRENEIVEKIKE